MRQFGMAAAFTVGLARDGQCGTLLVDGGPCVARQSPHFGGSIVAECPTGDGLGNARLISTIRIHHHRNHRERSCRYNKPEMRQLDLQITQTGRWTVLRAFRLQCRSVTAPPAGETHRSAALVSRAPAFPHRSTRSAARRQVLRQKYNLLQLLQLLQLLHMRKRTNRGTRPSGSHLGAWDKCPCHSSRAASSLLRRAVRSSSLFCSDSISASFSARSSRSASTLKASKPVGVTIL